MLNNDKYTLSEAQIQIIEATWASRPSQVNDNIEIFVDARALACPMPLLKAKIALRTLTATQSLYLLASDKHSQTDIAAFCQKNGYDVQTWQSQNMDDFSTIFCFFITKNV